MFDKSSDRHWEKYGKDDPYFGVYTDDKFHKNNLTVENKQIFLKSGENYVLKIIDQVKQHIDPNFVPDCVVDFGCGVGRLVIPLAGISKNVTGIDISESMLDEAKKNCEELNIKNANFINSDDMLSQLKGKINFIHSYIVFQHIPINRGMLILKSLLEHLQENGVGVLHFTYARHSKINNIPSFFREYLPFGHNLLNLIRGKGFFARHMQMNEYDLNKIFYVLQMSGVSQLYTEFTKHRHKVGIIIYFKKNADNIT